MDNLKLMSIDASTKKTGIAVYDKGNLIHYELLDFSEINDTEERIRKMCSKLLTVMDEHNPSIVVIEDSWNAMNVQVTKLLTRVMGVSFAWSIQHNAEWHTLLPSQWRKLANMSQAKKKRNELKQMSIDYVKELFGIDVNDDVADAISLGAAYYNYYCRLENSEDLFG